MRAVKTSLAALTALTLGCLAVCACRKSSSKTEPDLPPVPVQWTVKNVRPGLDWLSYRGLETVSGANQVINVLDLDLAQDDLQVEFEYYPAKTTMSSAIRQTEGAVAGTNASFGTPHTFIRTNGTTWCDITEADPNDNGNWYKHEAAIWFDGDRTFGVINCEGDPFGAITTYQATTYPNLFSSEPLLIQDHGDVTWVGKSGFTKKIRHPRTAVALTDDGHLLIITLDGRWYGMAIGMTLVELRDFLRLNFDPVWAINMDGGGSTTMYIQDQGKDGIVNYPCNGVSSNTYVEYEGSFTERSLPTFFVIREK